MVGAICGIHQRFCAGTDGAGLVGKEYLSELIAKRCATWFASDRDGLADVLKV